MGDFTDILKLLFSFIVLVLDLTLYAVAICFLLVACAVPWRIPGIWRAFAKADDLGFRPFCLVMFFCTLLDLIALPLGLVSAMLPTCTVAYFRVTRDAAGDTMEDFLSLRFKWLGLFFLAARYADDGNSRLKAAVGKSDAQIHKCIVCEEAKPQNEMPVCSFGLHAMCASCFESYAQAEFTQQEAVMRKRGARLMCPNRAPHEASCTGCFSDQTMARFLSEELHATYVDQSCEQIRSEEFTKANDMISRMAEQLKRDMPGLSHELLERQLQAALPGAWQCGKCGYGPIEHFACADLQIHHREVRGRTRINNACPECGWFTPDISSWPRWNGRVRTAAAQVSSLGSDFQIEATRSSSSASSVDPEIEQLRRQEQERLALIRSDHLMALRLSGQR